MINGVDVFLAALALVGIFFLWIFIEKYQDWSEWNEWRRRQRKRQLIRYKWDLEEEEYREALRRIFKINVFISAMNHTGEAFRKATESFERLNRALSRQQ